MLFSCWFYKIIPKIEDFFPPSCEWKLTLPAMKGFFSLPKSKVGPHSLIIVSLEIKWNAQNARKSGLVILTPMIKAVTDHFTKSSFDERCLKCPDLYTNLHKSTFRIGEEWVSARNCIKCQALSRKPIFHNPYSTWHGMGWSSIYLNVLLENWIKCPDIYRKVMVANSSLLWDGINFIKTSLLCLNEMSWPAQKRHVCLTPPHRGVRLE